MGYFLPIGWNQHHKKHIKMPLIKKLACVCLAPIFLLSIQPAEAILNCFKGMNKGPGQAPYGQLGERANWYGPQHQIMGYPSYSPYAMSPMKMLFQPKFKSGSWFGSKSGLGGAGGWNNWRMGAPFGRPNYGAYVPSPYAAPMGHGYQFNENMHVAPFTLPSPISPYSSAIQSAAQNALNSDVGWSVPINQSPIQQTSYETTANYAPTFKPQPVIDPYSIKGGNINQRLSTTTSTTKSLLMANGAYGALDSYLMGLNNNLRNQTYGYSYPPSWQSIQQQPQYVDSPAKIAQQLFKYNMRRQRLNNNTSAALLDQLATVVTTKENQFAILDEPRFVGFGTVDELSNNEARLSCSFNEAIDIANRPVWIKFLGPYNSSQIINGKNLPPFNCANSQCRTQEVESTKDSRYKFDNGPATSTLIITDPRLSDYGIYRCSALTKTLNNNPLETIYQIIRFGSLK